MDFNNNSNSYNNNMNGNPYGYQYVPPVNVPGSGLANAALVLGIISIVTAIMLTFYFPFIFGSIAIILALLSKGTAPKILTKAKSGIICASIGFVLNLVIWVYSFALLFSNPDVLLQTARTYDEMIEQIYGESSEEILGDSMEDMMNDTLELFK